MVLHRRPAGRPADARGDLVPLAEQDRALWDRAAIAEASALITATLAARRLGPYQLQAAIAAVHDEAASADATDWPQILGLLRPARRAGAQPRRHPQPRSSAGHGARAPKPASSCWRRSTATTAWPSTIAWWPCAPTCSRWPAPRPPARSPYREAARRTTSLPEQRYLEGRAARLNR
jgi:hypothetical protein